MHISDAKGDSRPRTMWDERVYTADLRDYSIAIEKTYVALLVNPVICSAEKITAWVGFVASPFLGLLVWAIMPEPLAMSVAVGLIGWVIVGGLCIIRICEVHRLRKMPCELLFANIGGECYLYDRTITIPATSVIAIQYVSDYPPSYYTGVRQEGSWNRYYEVNLIVDNNGVRKRYGLVGDRDGRVCKPISDQLSKYLNWPIVRWPEWH